MIEFEGRRGIVGTELAEVVFVMPDDLPTYSDLTDAELDATFNQLTSIGYRMMLIYTAILLEPEQAQLFDRALCACASMVREELSEESPTLKEALFLEGDAA